MLVFPFAKINLGLHVARKRDDGYHEIQSIMVPIPMYDALEAVVDRSLAPGELRMSRSGIPIPGDPQADLCMQAVKLIGQHRSLPGLRLHLHKAIPIGAGLGGGSSDGAHMLILLDRLLNLELEKSDLYAAAARLGSDPSFFLSNAIQLAQGRGESLNPLCGDLKGLWAVVINPGIHIATSEVYRNCIPDPMGRDLVRAFAGRDWSILKNDLEPYVLRTYPAVAAVKQLLTAAGAVHSAMSGSGSTVFGIFDRPPEVEGVPQGHLVWTFPL